MEDLKIHSWSTGIVVYVIQDLLKQMHTVLECEKLDDMREKYILESNEVYPLLDMPGIDILKVMLTREVVQITGRFSEKLFDTRKDLLYLAEEIDEEEV